MEVQCQHLILVTGLENTRVRCHYLRILWFKEMGCVGFLAQ